MTITEKRRLVYLSYLGWWCIDWLRTLAFLTFCVGTVYGAAWVALQIPVPESWKYPEQQHRAAPSKRKLSPAGITGIPKQEKLVPKPGPKPEPKNVWFDR